MPVLSAPEFEVDVEDVVFVAHRSTPLLARVMLSACSWAFSCGCFDSWGRVVPERPHAP